MDTPTKELIKESLLRLYDKNPIEKITVRMICDDAHISRSTFYSYFDTIDTVLKEIEDKLINDLFQINEKFKMDDFKNWKKGQPFPFFDTTLIYLQENAFAFRVFLERGNPRFIRNWKKIIKYHFREKFDIEKIRRRNPELALEVISSTALALYSYWLSHPDEITFEEVRNVEMPRIVFDLIQ